MKEAHSLEPFQLAALLGFTTVYPLQLADLGDWRVYDNCEPIGNLRKPTSAVSSVHIILILLFHHMIWVLGESLAIGGLLCLGILLFLYGQICEWPWHVLG
jgi:hypothetical protein